MTVAQPPEQTVTQGGSEVVPTARAQEAHRLRLSGLDWSTIAERTGYLDARIAAMAVTAYLQRAAIEHGAAFRRQALDLELAPLDPLQSGYWPQAVAGDTTAAGVVLKVMALRSRIFGFDRPNEFADEPARTIVIGGSTEEYIAGLKAISGDD